MGAVMEMEKLPFVNHYSGSWSRWESLMDNKAGGGKLEGKYEIDGNCDYFPINFHSYKIKTNLRVFGEGWQRCHTVIQLASAVLGEGQSPEGLHWGKPCIRLGVPAEDTGPESAQEGTMGRLGWGHLCSINLSRTRKCERVWGTAQKKKKTGLE